MDDVGNTLGELDTGDRLDLVQHAQDDIAVQRDLAFVVLGRGKEAIADRPKQRMPLLARALTRQAFEMLQGCRHTVRTELNEERRLNSMPPNKKEKSIKPG